MSAVRLTDRQLKALGPGPRREIWDKTVSGFGVRVGLSGRAMFVFRYRKNGKHRRVTIGPYSSVDLKAARTEAKDLAAAVARGEDPAHKPKVVLPQSFAETAEQFLNLHARRLSKSSYVEYKRLLQEPIKRWGDMPTAELEHEHVVGLTNEILSKGHNVTANRTRAVISSCLGWAVQQGLIKRNPLAGFKRPVKESPRDRVLTEPEIKTLWSTLEPEPEPLRSFLRFLLLTGQRSGETKAARWTDVDLNAGTWSIPRTTRKVDRAHLVPLSSAAVALLKVLPRSGEQIFPIANLYKSTARINAACKFAEKWTPHDLRRTASTRMAEMGTDQATIDVILGHNLQGIAGVYNLYRRQKEARAALDAWGQRVTSIVQDATPRKKRLRI